MCEGLSHPAEEVCRYTRPADYDKAFAEVKAALGAAFWGPPASGVYSPSVQYTLFQMAKLALERRVPPLPPQADCPTTMLTKCRTSHTV